MLFRVVLRKCLVELLTFKGNYKFGLLITKELSVYWFIFNISRAIFCADFSPFRPHLTQKNHHFDSKKSPFLTLAFALFLQKLIGRIGGYK